MLRNNPMGLKKNEITLGKQPNYVPKEIIGIIIYESSIAASLPLQKNKLVKLRKPPASGLCGTF